MTTMDAPDALARRLAILDAVTVAISEAEDLHGLLARALSTLMDITGVDGGGVFLVDEATGDLRLAVHQGADEGLVRSFQSTPSKRLRELAADPSNAVIVRDIRYDPVVHRASVHEAGVRAYAIAPLHVRGRVLGLLVVLSYTVHDFITADLDLLVSIGRQIGMAIDHTGLVERERRRSRQLAAINEVASSLSTLLTEAELLPQIVRSVRERLGYESATLILLDEEAGDLVAVAATGFSTLEIVGNRIPIDAERSITGWVAVHGRPLLANDVSQEPRFLAFGPDDPTRAELAVPLRVHGRILGVLDVQSTTTGSFHESDVEVLESLAAPVAVAIENARLHEDTKRALRRTRAFQDVTTAITGVLDPRETLERALDAAMDIFDADRAGIYLADSNSLQMGWMATRNLSDGYLAELRALFAAAPMFTVVDARHSRYYEDARAIRDLPPGLRDAVEKEGFRSTLSIPLRHGDEALGIFVLYHNEIYRYTAEEVDLAESFAGQAAIAIQHARLFEMERRSRSQTATILDATRAVTSSLQIDDVLHEAARCIAAAFRQQFCAVWMLDEEGYAFHPSFRVAGAANLAMDDLFHTLPPIPVNAAPRIRALVEAGVPYIAHDDDLSEPERAVQRLMPFVKYVAVPLAARERVLGAAAVPIRRTDHHIDQADMEVAGAIARSVALALENASLYEQSQQLAVSEERNRLARELHDSVTHSLFSITLIAQALPRLLEKDAKQARERMDRLTELGRGALAEMRALIFELRPAALENEGLASALAKHAAAFESREQIAVDLHVEGEDRAPARVEEAALRVAQEALHNVAKHANASRVTVRLIVDTRRLELTVQDNGTGFDVDSPAGRRTLGLTSMRERAVLLGGTCTVESTRGSGTTIRLSVPLSREA
jgi:signal transduction histidine kinase/putative methionine-R-sulfoxide reductase with GAF domain